MRLITYLISANNKNITNDNFITNDNGVGNYQNGASIDGPKTNEFKWPVKLFGNWKPPLSKRPEIL